MSSELTPIVVNNSHNLNYTLLPSAAQLGELPVYLANKALTKTNKGLKLAGYLAGYVAVPVSIIYTPVGIIADIIIGIAEAIFIKCKGADLATVKELLFKKVVVSPIHQMVSATTRTFFFICLLPAWYMSYFVSKVIIVLLPTKINHLTMNIFIEELNKETLCNSFPKGATINNPAGFIFDDDKADNEKFYAFDNSQSNYQNRIEEAITSMNQLNSSDTSSKYIEFKQKIINRCSARELFEFSSKGIIDKGDLIKKYRALCLRVHPDKNVSRKNEANALFLALQAAFKELLPTENN